jgi:hypothetical protein
VIKFKDPLNPYQQVSTELKFTFQKEPEQEYTAQELAHISTEADKKLDAENQLK